MYSKIKNIFAKKMRKKEKYIKNIIYRLVSPLSSSFKA